MKAAILIIITGLLILTATVVYTSQPQKTVTVASTKLTKPIEVPLDADTIFNLVNEERIKAGVKPLVRDARLDATAQERADDMVKRDYFSHYDPETGEGMIDKQNAGCRISENIIMLDEYGEKNTDAIKWWMNSESHRLAILKAQNYATGVAVSENIGVQHFCTR